jgi:hypothetical protein
MLSSGDSKATMLSSGDSKATMLSSGDSKATMLSSGDSKATLLSSKYMKVAFMNLGPCGGGDTPAEPAPSSVQPAAVSSGRSCRRNSKGPARAAAVTVTTAR